MKYSIAFLTVTLVGAQAFNAFGGNGDARTQPFDDQMHILPYPSGVTTGESHILPYYPDNKNSAEGVRSLPFPTGSSDEMRIQPSGPRFTRQTGDVRSLPYFPGNNAHSNGFKAISSGSGTNGQVRMLSKSTESDEMRIQPFPTGQRVTRATAGDAQILPYFPTGKDTTSGRKTMPFPSGSNGKDQVRILPTDNGIGNDEMRIQPISAGNGDFNIQPLFLDNN